MLIGCREFLAQYVSTSALYRLSGSRAGRRHGYFRSLLRRPAVYYYTGAERLGTGVFGPDIDICLKPPAEVWIVPVRQSPRGMDASSITPEYRMRRSSEQKMLLPLSINIAGCIQAAGRHAMQRLPTCSAVVRLIAPRSSVETT